MNQYSNGRMWDEYDKVINERDALQVQLDKALTDIEDLVHQGFAVMYCINQAITYDNEVEAQKGRNGLPIRVVEKMNEFIQLLHNHDPDLPVSPE